MESRNKIYIISAIFVVLVAGFVACSVFLFAGIMQKSKDLSSGKEKVVILEKEFNDIEAFKKQYSSYQASLEKIDQLFIDSRNPVGFIEFLEKTSSDYELNLEVSIPTFSTGAVTAGNFQFSLSGSFSKIFGFIKEIENGPYLIQILNLNIEKSQKADQLKANLSIRVLAK